ncbi:MAG: DUF5017 domain-containing protein, partial [Muribaculaceae bacterium]|nr:DUF5017 domain-containing protein [Muribaculaceae bacterium]
MRTAGILLISLISNFAYGRVALGNTTLTDADSFTVDELLEQGLPAYPVPDTWVTGYIVGCIDGKSIQSDCNFSGNNFATASNILLAGSSSEDDYTYCIPVQLPNGDIRAALNLVDHPENLGHQVTLCGSNEKYFGVNAIKSTNKYEWVGDAPIVEEVIYPVEATGSAEKPLTVAEFQAAVKYGNLIPDTYLKGIIVGYVPGMSFDEGVIGTIGDDVTVTNILVADDAMPSSLDECVPVQLPAGAVRDAINLKDNPDNLGKTVTLVGVHTSYFGQTGLKEVSAYAFGDGEIVTPIEPNPYDAFYAGLITSDEGWKYDNVIMPEELSYIWKWNDSSGYLYASGYSNMTYHTAESYAISPLIDLTQVSEATLTFDHSAKFQTNLLQDCKLVVREWGATNWNELTIPTWPPSGVWTWTNSGEIDLKDYVGKAIEIGFKYVSTDSAADTWEIKNFIINATPVTPDDSTDNGTYYMIGSDVNGHVWELAQEDCKFQSKGNGIY